MMYSSIPKKSSVDEQTDQMRTYQTRWMVATCLLALGLVSSAASASDGVIEINQTCATYTGCFAGDAASFPVTIETSAPARSFRLTSDLIVPVSTDGIRITISDVHLDLNGFRIVRSGCQTASSACNSAEGSGSGVDGSTTTETTVRNGSIVGMGFNGLQLARGANVSHMTIKWNARFGIFAGNYSRVVESRIFENGVGAASGVVASGGSILKSNIVANHGGYGIAAQLGGAILVGNNVGANGLDGIYAVSGSAIIRGNTSSDNGGDGISTANAASSVMNNTTNGNATHGITVTQGSTVFGNTATQNSATGITATSGSMVHRNMVQGNASFGLSFSGTASYRDNTVTSNTGGTVNSGIDMGGNSCDGATTCP